MMNYLQYFFSPAHLFTTRPSAMTPRAAIILFAGFIALAVLGVLLKWFAASKRDALQRRAFNRFFQLTITMAAIGMLYVFFAWQGITLLAARFWLLVWLAVFLVWAGFIVKYWIKDIPVLRARIDQKRNFEKYLP